MISVSPAHPPKPSVVRARGRVARRGLATAGIVALVAAAALAAVGMVNMVTFLRRDEPVTYEDELEHFKYGSVGTEAVLGIPLPIFKVLPVVFEDLLPPGAGNGYERLGLSYEQGHPLPAGTSVRAMPIPLVGLNCAACHSGTLRRAPGDPPEFLLGAPGNRFNSSAFLQFLIEVGTDPRFEAGRLFAAMDAMEEKDLALSWTERAAYRLVVIPRTRARLLRLREQLSWIQRRPAFGPGRMDSVNTSKVLFGLDMSADDSIGTADYPPLYNQRIHQGGSLHWVSNDEAAINRVLRWSQDLQPPVFPRWKIDLGRAER